VKGEEKDALDDFEEIEVATASDVARDLPVLDRIVAPETSSLQSKWKVNFKHWRTGAIMGTQSIVRPGQPDEAISVYCRLHQCKCPMKLVRHAPSTDAIQQWFKDGDALPSGASGREDHLRMYRGLL
jgi:hypothetical protein